ncbi:MAG: PAS domain S-box protein [Dehalococcoidia bacterium]|nr:PAS domain S-box protein [Dehalococcoidia bacterium]
MSAREWHTVADNPRQQLEHLRSVVRAIRAVRQLISFCREPEELVQKVCSLLVETRDYHSAWIVLVDGEGRPVTAVHAGLGDDFGPMMERVGCGELTACGRSALAEPGVLVIHSPFKECVECPLSHVYEDRSAMTVRLAYGGRVYGVMSVSVPAAYAHDTDEVELVRDVAEDVASALDSLSLGSDCVHTGEALRESEQRHRTLVEQSMDAIYIGRPDGKVMEVNQAWLDLFGYVRGDLASANAIDFYVEPSDRDTFVREMTEKGFVQDEVLYKRKDGTVFHCQRAQVALKDERGNVLAYQGILRDVSETKQSLRELRRSEERYRALFEQSMDAISVVAPDGTALDVNQAWLDLLGYSRDDLDGFNVIDVYANPRDRDELLSRIAETGNVRDVVHVRKKDGTPMTCQRTVVVQRDGEGAMVACQAVLRDVSLETRAYDRLEEAFIDLVETTSRAMESVDPYTVGHQRRVARLAELVGRRLGLSDSRLQGLYVGAMLHDVGKLSLPSTILTKPGKLSVHEWNLMRSHPRRGYDILMHSNLPWPIEIMALDHHERLDGTGYPGGKSGEALSLEVRILGVCDVIEAMSSDRPYRPARSPGEVISEIMEGAGSKYDPEVTQAALGVISDGLFSLSEPGTKGLGV